jgi:hypothetical protein
MEKKMRQKYFFTAAVLALMSAQPLVSSVDEILQTKKISQDILAQFPVPKDNRNYMFFQSIGDDAVIVIGDFSGVDKKIIMISDRNNDNTIDSVFEYTPFTKDLRRGTDSTSRFFTKDIARLKKEIIEGTIYTGNFTDKMESLKTLEKLLKESNTNSLNADVYGFVIKSFEADVRSKNSALFAYGKSAGGYYLQFKTEYYRKDKNTKQAPVLRYSVYCKDSNDPVVKETVENLFKIKQPIVNFDKSDSRQKSR